MYSFTGLYEKFSFELLKEIISVWVTMRGFTIAGCWTTSRQQKYMHQERIEDNINNNNELTNCRNVVCIYIVLWFSLNVVFSLEKEIWSK